jgi:hypothetical protein
MAAVDAQTWWNECKLAIPASKLPDVAHGAIHRQQGVLQAASLMMVVVVACMEAARGEGGFQHGTARHSTA